MIIPYGLNYYYYFLLFPKMKIQWKRFEGILWAVPKALRSRYKLQVVERWKLHGL